MGSKPRLGHQARPAGEARVFPKLLNKVKKGSSEPFASNSCQSTFHPKGDEGQGTDIDPAQDIAGH